MYLFKESAPYTLGRCLLDELQCEDNCAEHVCVEMKGAAGYGLKVESDGGLPLAHSEDCPCRCFCRTYRVSFQHSTRVEVCVQVLVESADGLFLIARQDLHLMQFPKAWGALGGPLAPGEAMEQVIVRKADNAGIRLTFEEGTLLHNGASCYCHAFFLFENVYPVTLDLGLPVIQQLIVFHHIQLQVSAKSVRLTTKAELDICAWLSPSQLQEIRDRRSGELEGIWKQSKPCRVSYLQLSGFAPNEVGEGFSRSAWAALWHWLATRVE